ncbi:thermonuclease family protein [Nesterenkonia salmonea]|uniref:Thermonuclease family protein n=1 Tax=Nesterenkonia salmonea TaxID=1804987 RepID=A0A5R9B8W8_9MICC|nr:thermonuclease family protein [Nesterenkonia salmonea]TLP93295.1 thermonuclease family protein [Nesterenkonia salmonea]
MRKSKRSCCGCLLIIIVFLAVLGGIANALSDGDNEPAQSASTPTAVPVPTGIESEEPVVEESEEEAPTKEAETEPESPSPSPTPDPPPPAAEDDDAVHTAVVTRIVDGDTVELDNSDIVRLLGMDTPERGECHFDTATERMSELVLNETVTLTRDGDDADHYGRILRYIDVDGTDAGLTLIEEGLAVSRYDSRDGYGFHSREPDYIAADDGTVMQTCAPVPVPDPPEGENCDPNYTPCVPPYPPNINCSDIDFAVEVIGSDPHGLDGDGDGIGCEGNR